MVDNDSYGRHVIVLMIMIITIVITLLAGNAGAATEIDSCTLISSPGEYVLNTSIDNASTCIYITSNDVILDGAGYTIDGTKAEGTYGVYVYNSTIPLLNVTITNLSVTNWDSGIYLNSSSNSTLTGNNASSNAYGIWLESSSNSTLTGNTASSNSYGILLESSSDNNNLTGNDVSSNFYGIQLADSSGNNNLTGNTASSNDYGILVHYYSDNNTLTNNTASSNKEDGILVDYSSDNNTLTGNTASSNSQYGIHLDTSSKNNNLTNNNASSNSQYGIYLSSSGSNILTGNTASSNMNRGIYLESSSSNILTNNNASSNSHGIHLHHSSNNNLTGNNASSNSYDGILVESSSDNNTLTNNTASSNSQYGIHLESSSNNNILTGNNASSNIYDGIHIVSSSNNNLTGNNASSNSYDGIYLVSSGNNNLTNNNASSNSQYGIYLNFSSDNNNLTNNNASSNSYDGIRLYFSGNNNLTGNTASSNSQYGIYLNFSSDNNNLTNNSANSNSYDGIRIDSSGNNNLTNNNASSNSQYGIRIYSSGDTSSDNNTLTGNTASSNENDGIRIWSSDSNTLTGNTASSNSHYGIYLFSSGNNNLTGNTASSNSYGGIRIYSTGDTSSDNNTLTGNTASSNENDGISIHSSGSNNLTGNTASSNSEYGIYLDGSRSNNLTGNTASSNSDGIYLSYSSNNNLTGNNASNNTMWAFFSASNSINNTVTNLTINPTISFTGKDVAIKSAASPASDPDGYKNISKFINATNNSADSWLFLNVSYSGSDVAGLNESTLRMWQHDGSAWSQVPEPNNVDTEQKDVYANITAFSIFAPMAKLYNISGYKINDTNGNGTWDSGEAGIQGWNITLRNATSGLEIANTSTNAQGFYQFSNLDWGSGYNVSEEKKIGWMNTNATFQVVTLYNDITNLNFTNINDIIPPASVEGLHNITFASRYINWTWIDPSDEDFAKVMVYLNGTFQVNVTKGMQYYNATGLIPNTSYNISTHTVDDAGNINQTWRNHTAKTAPNLPPTATFTVNSPVQALETVTANPNGTYDPNGDPLTLTWQWGDGSTTVTAGVVNATHQYTLHWNYTINLSVYDGFTTTNTSRTVNVTNDGVTISFASGWNHISTPIFNSTPAGVLFGGGVVPGYVQIWGWNRSIQNYEPAGGSNLQVGEGYFVWATGSRNVIVRGNGSVLVYGDLNIQPGWNMVGPGVNTITTPVWAYHWNTGTGVYGYTRTMIPGMGYWILG